MKTKEKDFAVKLLRLVEEKACESGKAIEYSDDKQLMYYLEKWTRKGWWNYGVSLRSGWFTPEGITQLKAKIEEMK